VPTKLIRFMWGYLAGAYGLAQPLMALSMEQHQCNYNSRPVKEQFRKVPSRGQYPVARVVAGPSLRSGAAPHRAAVARRSGQVPYGSRPPALGKCSFRVLLYRDRTLVIRWFAHWEKFI
jgi:hypothetical protein